MSDHELRALERRWHESGDAEQGAELLRARLRRGLLHPDGVELAAYLGHLPARALLGLAEGDERLPRDLFRAGLELRLPCMALEPPPCLLEARTQDDALKVLVRAPRRMGLDLGSVARVRPVLEELLDLGARALVLDLGNVRYVSSTGLSLLVGHAERLVALGGELGLVQVPQKIGIVLDMLNLNAYFARSPDALAALAEERGRAVPAPPARDSRDQVWLRGLLRWGEGTCRAAADLLGVGALARVEAVDRALVAERLVPWALSWSEPLPRGY